MKKLHDSLISHPPLEYEKKKSHLGSKERGIGGGFLKRAVTVVGVPTTCVHKVFKCVCVWFGGWGECLKLISNHLRRDAAGLPRNLTNVSAAGSHRVEHLSEQSQLGSSGGSGEEMMGGWHALSQEHKMCVSNGADSKGK